MRVVAQSGKGLNGRHVDEVRVRDRRHTAEAGRIDRREVGPILVERTDQDAVLEPEHHRCHFTHTLHGKGGGEIGGVKLLAQRARDDPKI